MSLQEQIRRAQQGDIGAFEAVVRETATAVRAFLAIYVRDLDEVDDLAQETYLYAFENLGEFAAGTDFHAYLKTIARTQALRTYRARERKQTAHRKYVLAVQDCLAEATEQIEQSEQVESLLAKLHECLRHLSAHAEKLVRLRYFEQRSLRTIADQLGRPAGSVGVALFRVRQELSVCLQKQAAS